MLIAFILAVALIFVLPRKHRMVPFLFFLLLAAGHQQFYVAGVHLFLTRLLIYCAWVGLFLRKPSGPGGLLEGRWNPVDTAFLCWALCRATAFILLNREVGAVVNQFGFLSDSLGCYFMLRFLISDEEDVRRTIKTIAAATVVIAVCMAYERARGINPFGFIGGTLIPDIRNGSFRAQGPFAHALLAGTFGGVMVPLFVWLWKSAKSKVLAFFSLVGCTAMAIESSTSTAVIAYGASILGICFWPLRGRMRMVRWGFVLALISLHLIMKAPVWFVIAHVDIVGGSSADHRAYIIDFFIRNFWDWWLIGTNNAANWGWDMWDICNQFVAEGETGGLLTLIFFIAMISYCFSRIGNARKIVTGDSDKEWSLWLFGAALFANIVGFFGIGYFDQSQFTWYALLCMISVMTSQYLPAANPAPANTEISRVGPGPARSAVAAPGLRNFLGSANGKSGPKRLPLKSQRVR